MNPEDYLKLIDRMIKAKAETANAKKAWFDMACCSTLGMSNEVAEVYRNECVQLFKKYKQSHEEALKIWDMFDAANEDKP